jgi:predicted ArsR family transcriptional regulator
MRTHHPQLTAHKGLRAEILLALKRAQPLTAKQLAHQLGVSVNAIRHHLKELEAEALIAYGREQRGVGAPTFAYRLSPNGEGLFPRAYEETLTQLLQRVAEQGGRQAAVGLFEDHYRDLTHQLQAELAGAAASERLDLVARLMNQQGYGRRRPGRSGCRSITVRSAPWPSASPRCVRPKSGSCGTCSARRSSGAPTSRAAATPAST